MNRPLAFHPSRLLLAAACLWATAATASLTIVRRSTPLLANQRHYHRLAERIIDEHRIDIPFDQSVLYPGFIATIYRATDRNPQWVRLVQSLLTGFVVLLVGILATKLSGPWPGAIAASAMAVTAILPVVGSQLVPTIPAMVLLVGSLLCLAKGFRVAAEGGAALLWSLAGGITAGLAAAFQSFVMGASVLVGLSMLAIQSKRRLGLIFLLGLSMTPISVGTMTWLRTGRFVALTNNAGLNLYIGHNPSADGTDPFFDPLQRATRRRLENINGPTGLERAWIHQALSFVARCRGRSIALAGRKIALFIDRAEPGNNERPATIASSSPLTRYLPGTWIVMALAVAGLAWRRPDKQTALFAAGLILGSLAISVLFFSCARFRLPALVGFALLAGSLWNLPKQIRNRRRAAGWAAGAALVMTLAALGAQAWLGPTSPAGLLVNEAITSLQLKHPRKAKRLLEQALQRRPDDLLARLYLARMARDEGRICEALYQAAVAVLADPTSSAARKTLARLGREANISSTRMAVFGQKATKLFDRRLASFVSSCRTPSFVPDPAKVLRNACKEKIATRSCLRQRNTSRQRSRNKEE